MKLRFRGVNEGFGLGGAALLVGADIRQYRRLTGLTQVIFASRMGISQSALSLLESGRIAVSADHIDQLQRRFVGRDLESTFDEFLKSLKVSRATAEASLAASVGRYLTLTVWRWEDGFDLGHAPAPELAVNMVTVRASGEITIAFQMPRKSPHWQKDEILVFEECRPADILHQDVCLVQFKPARPKALKTVLAIARSTSARGSSRQLTLIAPRCPTLDAGDEAIRILMRAVFRGRRV